MSTETQWAAENLQTIRTLMERSALYRQALAPMMFLAGGLGLGTAALGWQLHLQAPRDFVLWWLGAGLMALAGALLLARRQALRAAEAFWTLPTRRVAFALLPACMAGLVLGLAIALPGEQARLTTWLLPPLWMVLYGCALNATGFFLKRGVKLFGWGYLGLGSALLLWVCLADRLPPLVQAHLVMGLGFGGGHLAYGLYLHWTERNLARP